MHKRRRADRFVRSHSLSALFMFQKSVSNEQIVYIVAMKGNRDERQSMSATKSDGH